MTICQLQKKIISLLLLISSTFYLYGCAETPVAAPPAGPKKTIQAEWFLLPPRFTVYEKQDEIAVHPFFDINWKTEDYEDWSGGKSFKLPYFITTPAESDYQYNLDLNSGKLYRERVYCSTEDVWGSYTSSVNKPNFTQGIVPRVYNEIARPQEVIIFSSESFQLPFSKNPNTYADAKIIGSVVVETCVNYPCDLKEKWSKTQILVGVPYEDPQFGNLENFMSLKNKINWNYAKAMLANMNGNHFLGGRYVPATRVLRELGKAESRDYFNKNSNILTPGVMDSTYAWRRGCMKLYDMLWDESEKIRTEKSDQSQKFFTFFQNFYTKNSDQLYSCMNLVRPANILENTRRFWFFAYIRAFSLLEKNGMTYNCRNMSWMVHSKLEFGRCRANNFEKTFEQAINGLHLMKTQLGQQFRFVEYDTYTGGSHQPIFSWLYSGQRSYGCKSESDMVDTSNIDIFPQDVEWENFQRSNERVLR